jgi:hypothetical protein
MEVALQATEEIGSRQVRTKVLLGEQRYSVDGRTPKAPDSNQSPTTRYGYPV